MERVLIELGHGETALAYARYRDKRARIRALRSGNLRPLLHELEEARRSPDGGDASLSLFVRTSDDALVAWNRKRIIEALVRETRIDPDRADLIAMEVENQILAAQVRTLTASLVRELVDAKLLEHGLEEYRKRHMRLGVPLYDAERIICLPNRAETLQAHHPRSTDLELAARVKKEFALAHLLPDEVSDAHLRGDIHIHGLGCIDRLHACRCSAEYVMRFGMPDPAAGHSARPARGVSELLLDLGRFSSTLGAHVAGTVSWGPINAAIAPCAVDMDDEAARRFAQFLLIGLAQRHEAWPTAPSVKMDLCWDMPGARPSAPAPRPAEAEAARRLAIAILDVYRSEALAGSPLGECAVGLRCTEATFRTPGHLDFIRRAAELVTASREVRFRFQRSVEAPDGWHLSNAIVACISINLPRAAYRAQTEAGLLEELDRIVATAASAHAAKHDFIERLLAVKPFGPLAFLASEQDSSRLFELSSARYRIGIVGLNECIQTLLGRQLHEEPQALETGRRIAAHIADACRRHGRRMGIQLEPSSIAAENAHTRFASVDLHTNPEKARAHVKTCPITQDIFYTPGAAITRDADLTPMERVRMEGRLFEPIADEAFTRIEVRQQPIAPASMVDFIKKAFHHTNSPGIIFTP